MSHCYVSYIFKCPEKNVISHISLNVPLLSPYNFKYPKENFIKPALQRNLLIALSKLSYCPRQTLNASPGSFVYCLLTTSICLPVSLISRVFYTLSLDNLYIYVSQITLSLLGTKFISVLSWWDSCKQVAEINQHRHLIFGATAASQKLWPCKLVDKYHVWDILWWGDC